MLKKALIEMIILKSDLHLFQQAVQTFMNIMLYPSCNDYILKSKLTGTCSE